MKSKRGVLLGLGLISMLAMSAGLAQSLGDVARAEREKRNKKASARKVYTNDELPSRPPDALSQENTPPEGLPVSARKADIRYDSSRLRGNANAPVVLAEFSDFSCPVCQRVQPRLDELLARYPGRVSLAYRDFPLVPLDEGLSEGRAAAEASRCAAEQGRFWQYHDLVFAGSEINAENLRDYARRAGLDQRRFDSCFAGGKYRDQVEQDRQDGKRLGVSGTPCFAVNGRMLKCGAYSTEAFAKIVEAELAAAQQK